MQVVIIGNGIAGISTAVELRKISSCQIKIISSEHDYFFSRTALMYVFMGQMLFEHLEPYERSFWAENKIELIKASVNNIDFNKQFLFLDNSENIKYDKLVIASGSTPINLNIQGENIKGVHNLYFKNDLENLLINSKNISQACVVGGGLTGIEFCEMLISRGIKVHFLLRDKYFWNSVLPIEDAAFVHNYLKSIPLLEIHENSSIEKIICDESGKLSGILKNNNEKITSEILGVCIGVKPNIKFLHHTEIEINRGILVDEFLETSIKNVYAVGDCAELKFPENNRKSIEPVWHVAKKMGECVSSNIIDLKKKYSQGIWKNSAKFFEMEFHCVGLIKNNLSENEDEFIWKNINENKMIHIVFDKIDKTFKAINSYGIRLRINLIEDWIKDKKDINYVLKNINKALYNLELSKDYSKEINQIYLSKN